MRKLITNLTFQIIKEKLMKKNNPLFFLVPNVYMGNVYCYGDNYQNNNNYGYFTGDNNFNSTESVLFDIIFGKTDMTNTKNLQTCSTDLVKPFNFDLNKTSISLMTIINLSKGATNNPPNPPFININKLKQIINILNYFKQIQQSRSDFYNSNFENLFKPVIQKIKNYLIGQFSDPAEIIGKNTSSDAKKELEKSGIIEELFNKFQQVKRKNLITEKLMKVKLDLLM